MLLSNMTIRNIVKSIFPYSVPLLYDDKVEDNCGVFLTGMTLLSPSPPLKLLKEVPGVDNKDKTTSGKTSGTLATAAYHMTESSFPPREDHLDVVGRHTPSMNWITRIHIVPLPREPGRAVAQGRVLVLL
jgi:hypothetical protein